jgi:hypothetical protein
VFGLGIAATVVSTFYYIPLEAVGPCGPGISGGGFPLPWYLTFTQYLGPVLTPCSFAFEYTQYGNIWASFSFLFDTIFYAAIVMVRNELHRWIGGKRQPPRKHS